jgi:chromosome segregation ATPase
MSDDSSPIKAAIQDQLYRFDITSKKIELIKQSSGNFSAEYGRLTEKLRARNTELASTQKEIGSEEYIEQNLQNEHPPNMKKLEKQRAKIGKLRTTYDETNRAVETITQKIADLEKIKEMESKLDELQATYKQILANLMNLHNRYPDAYKQAELESGIFFLTSPGT